MNNIEEQLWDYIDGTCTAAQRDEITRLIATNDKYKILYGELLALNADFESLETDDPSMAFTYNVMEQIRTQEAAVPLKAAINKKLIQGIAAFFILTILALVGIALSDVTWSSVSAFKMPAQVNQLQNIFTGKWMVGFVFFYVVCALLLLDAYLQKKGAKVQALE